jgi:hypothetical protein
MDDEKLRALPRDVPDYHIRQAAHLRALAENAPTSRVKAGLLRDADEHEPARWSGRRASLSNPPNRQDRLPARIAPAAAEQRFYIARSIVSRELSSSIPAVSNST